MPANFWFEDRTTEKYFYYAPPSEENGWRTDWTNKIMWDEETLPPEGVMSIYRRGDTTTLQRVDEMICDFMGDPAPNVRMDSRFYMMCHELGFYSLVNLGGGYVEERHVEWMKTKCFFMSEHLPTTFGPFKEGWNQLSEVELARRHALLEWVFLKKWRFHATG